eukprot:GCRY01001392.1.p1 GENE.GCRY01001392.1~~GCRY01001392.1.p1  ORF type:complete len:297 (+),score=67.81 GCRY01001392.1:80-970(+)
MLKRLSQKVADYNSDSESEVEEVSGDEYSENEIARVLEEEKKSEIENLLKNTPKKGEKTTVYLNRLPHGFTEKAVRDFFGQFGTISGSFLPRNKKTGKSKHFGFLQFKDREVAEIVCETMNNYLMFGRLLEVKIIPEEDVHPDTFNPHRKPFRKVPFKKMAKNVFNRPKTSEEVERSKNRLLKKEQLKKMKLKDLGIDYDFPGYSAAPKTKSKKRKTSKVKKTETAVDQPKKKIIKKKKVIPATAESEPTAVLKKVPKKAKTAPVAKAENATPKSSAVKRKVSSDPAKPKKKKVVS